MHLSWLLLLAYSFASFSSAAINVKYDVENMAMKVVEDSNLLPLYLDHLQQNEQFEGFCLLAEMAPFNLDDPEFSTLVKKLLENDQSAYIDALMQNQFTPGLEKFIVNIKDSLLRRYRVSARAVTEEQTVQMLYRAYKQNNLASFKALTDETYFSFDSESSPIVHLIDVLAKEGARPFLDVIASSELNQETFELQIYIADRYVNYDQKEAPKRLGEIKEEVKVVVPEVVPAPAVLPCINDAESEDCKVHSTLAPRVKMWVSGQAGNIDLSPLNGKNGIFIKKTSNPNVYYMAILEGNPKAVPEGYNMEFFEWNKALLASVGQSSAGMTMQLNLENGHCTLRRLGQDQLSSSFVIVHEQEDNENELELYEGTHKFYNGETQSVAVKLCPHDTIVFAPTQIMKSNGAQEGAHFVLGAFSNTFEPSAIDRMASFGEASEYLTRPTGPIDLYAIFLQ